MGQSLRILKFLYSGRSLHIMNKKQLEFIKFGLVVIRIQHNCVYPVLFLERQELRPINKMHEYIVSTPLQSN